MSWGRVTHPSEVVRVGDEIDVVVLKYDPGTERVSLGHKQLVPDPWSNVIERYPVGIRVTGKVVSLTDYGAFIELEPGVEGLIHVSEMSWSKRVKHPSKILNSGRQRRGDGARRRSGRAAHFARPEAGRDAIRGTSSSEKYPVGTTITGKVRNLTEFGAFVEVEEGIDGLIHISDMSWSKIKHPSEVLKKGDTVEAQVLSIDADNQRLSLGLKQLQTGIWTRVLRQAPRRRRRRGQGRASDQLRRVRRAGRRHRGPDSRLGVRLVAGRRRSSSCARARTTR